MKYFSLLLAPVFILGFALAQDPATKAPATPDGKAAAAAPATVPAAVPAAVPGNLLDAAIAKAKKENKLLFVKYGWERCSNCRHLDRLISESQVKVSDEEFVVVEVHPVQGQDRVKFANYYGIKSGIYPRVVICDTENKVLAKRTGHGAATQYNELLAQARQKLAASSKPAVKPE